jgi:hypothetical protein
MFECVQYEKTIYLQMYFGWGHDFPLYIYVIDSQSHAQQTFYNSDVVSAISYLITKLNCQQDEKIN